MLSTGWLIVGAGFLILMVSWGSQLAFSVFLVPLTQEFGWDRASTAGVFSLSILIFGATLLISSESPDKGPSFSRKNGSFPPAGDLDPGSWNLPPSGPLRLDSFRAMGTRTFWMIFSAYLLWCNGFYMVSVHLAAYGIDSGFTPTQAALAVSLIGGGSIFGLLGFRSMPTLYLFSTLFGFGCGGTGPQLPVVTAKVFGISSLGAIFGVLILSGQIGGALGPLLAGMIDDLFQNYFYGFLLGGVFILVSFRLMSFLKFPRSISP